ncbi:hypothetical protein FPR31_01280 [Salmonella enterica]|nr:hypothetical protein [Salmonella enterica]ECI2571969.1 hypothetical protein [Salmonella enterica subsp. enterica serovar Muenchen]ECH4227416.1 hypothetical protein [Salmonella enterica]ECH4237899.1 hypothetical protein [Salmonella enterica]ECL6033173.1 hypothetical protein [Salmonella enterica]
MRNERLQVRRSQAAARRSVNESVEYVKVTMTKEHASRVSRAFYDSRNDKGNYEFVCVAE